MANIHYLQDEVTLLTSKLENMTKTMRMLNNGSDMFDEILQVGKRVGDLKGIWFVNQPLKRDSRVAKPIPKRRVQEPMMSEQMFQHRGRHQNAQVRN